MIGEHLDEHERGLIGRIVEGRVEAVFRWGVIVDLELSRVALIDALYVDDGDKYYVGQKISGYLDCFDAKKNEFILRPLSQIPLADRLSRQRSAGTARHDT